MKWECVGFFFSKDKKQVVLIRKNRPKWQKHKLNGAGGRVEGGETAHVAQAREFKEETGIETKPGDWTLFAERLWLGNERRISYLFAFGDVGDAKSVSDEIVGVFDLDYLHLEDTVPDVRWLIPLALDETVAFPFEVYSKRGHTS